MKNDIYEIRNRLDRVDLDVLHNIYLFRCLTIRQIYNNFYAKSINTFNKFLDKKLNELLSYGVVEEVYFNKDNVALFLTKIGIEVVREAFDLPVNIVDHQKKVVKRGYYRASELKMLPRLIPHQVHLNQFVLDFKKVFNHRGLPMVWKYFDEKYVSQYINIRPDGLIRLLDTDFFLEMDMNTESKAQLIEKWKHYRAFLTSREYKYNEKKIIVLFIIENTSNIENRKNIVRMTASEILLDIIDGDFEIIVGTKEELLRKIFNNLIPNILQTNYKVETLKNILTTKHEFSIADGTNLKSKLNNSEYGYYIRKVDEHNNVVVEQGRIQEYLLDYYCGDSLSVINKIAYLQTNSSTFKYYFNRDISYIVVCDDLKAMYADLEMFDLQGEDCVYYTTIDRLNKYPFSQAICQFDNLGRPFSFKDNSLSLRSYLNE